MEFPPGLWDVSLWLAIVAIILLATSELVSPYRGQTNLLIDKKRLRRVALVVGILFLMTLALRVFFMLIP
jgi:hypothetical protein